MTLDWQVMVVAFVAMSLRLVAMGSNPDVARADDEQLHQERTAPIESQLVNRPNLPVNPIART
jgi:hypothetical protein